MELSPCVLFIYFFVILLSVHLPLSFQSFSAKVPVSPQLCGRIPAVAAPPYMSPFPWNDFLFNLNYLPSYQLSLYPSYQHLQVFPGNLRLLLQGRKVSWLQIFTSSRSPPNPVQQAHPPALWKKAFCGFPFSPAPIWSHTLHPAWSPCIKAGYHQQQK